MDTDEMELLEDSSDVEEDGGAELADGELAAANMLEENEQVQEKAKEAVAFMGGIEKIKPAVEAIFISPFGPEKRELPGGGMYVQQKDGTQTIYTGRTFNQQGNTAQMEHVTINPDGSVSVAGEGTTIRQKGDKTVIATAAGDRIIVGPQGIESYRTAKGDAVDLVRVKKLAPQDVQEKQEVQEKQLNAAALQAAAEAKAIARLTGAAKDASTGKLDAKTIDSLVQHFQGRNVNVIDKINAQLEGLGGKFKVSAAKEVGANGDVKHVYRLTVRATGQTVATQSIRR
ncbi:MAG: hypothetical protein K2W95_09555 [Candidatus Obscuribacterales bacterium]|nr:hypothetical protein [Candidatus Obscuribacterales bacterium]